jgi:hypothetical protein
MRGIGQDRRLCCLASLRSSRSVHLDFICLADLWHTVHFAAVRLNALRPAAAVHLAADHLTAVCLPGARLVEACPAGARLAGLDNARCVGVCLAAVCPSRCSAAYRHCAGHANGLNLSVKKLPVLRTPRE